MSLPVNHCRRKVRELDAELAQLDARRDTAKVRELTGHRLIYANILQRAGHPVPPPIVAW